MWKEVVVGANLSNYLEGLRQSWNIQATFKPSTSLTAIRIYMLIVIPFRLLRIQFQVTINSK